MYIYLHTVLVRFEISTENAYLHRLHILDLVSPVEDPSVVKYFKSKAIISVFYIAEMLV